MAITAATNTPPTTPTTPPARPADADKATAFANGDFETFLKMLTTQIKNQDPLNPMEGSDFAVQLATFSGVEQQVRTNQLLTTMAGANGQGLAALSNWLGREVRTTAPVAFDHTTPLTMEINPAAGAKKVTLVTLNALGREVLREDIGQGAGEIDWVGRTAQGALLPKGLYSFKLESADAAGELIESKNVGIYQLVTGAEATATGVRLSLPGGAFTLESQVSALRAAR